MKRYGTPPISGQKYRRRPGSYVILPMDDHILLTMQDGDEPELQLPGGGVERGEQPIPALHREVIEETGWVIHRPIRLGVYKRNVFMPEYDLWAEKICTIYVARPAYRLCDPTEAGHTAHILPVDLALEWMTEPGQNAFVRGFFNR